jgi:hypothetical protein
VAYGGGAVDPAVRPAAGPGERRRGRAEGHEAEVREDARGARIERVGHDDEAAVLRAQAGGGLRGADLCDERFGVRSRHGGLRGRAFITPA